MQILCAEGDFYEKSILTALGCLLLDRVSLSARNGRRDGEGRTYAYYVVAEICEDFGCSRVTAGKLLSELERIGRIERKKQGQGKPDRIYVLQFCAQTGLLDFPKRNF